MKFISVQPAIPYFVWQLEVLDKSLVDNGYNLNDFYVMFLHDGNIPENVLKYAQKQGFRVIFEKDDRADKSYIPSIKLYGLSKFYEKNSKIIEGHNLFLHDSDIVFTKYVDWDAIVVDNKTVYCSDTISYVGAVYLDSKSPELTDRMCKIVGIDPQVVRSNQLNSGGAQYIFPKTGMTAELFKKAEVDSTNVYRFTSGEGTKYKKPEDPYPVQSWTAEMHVILWNLWLAGFKTEVHRSMTFSWPSWSDKDWTRVPIYHNSGVVNASSGQFFKGQYINKMPFGSDFSTVTKRETCNWKYCEIIQELDHLKTFYS